jgi:hypothetical protein
LIHIEIDLLSPVEGKVVRVDAFFALLAESLLEVWAYDIGGVFLLFLGLLEPVDIVVEGVEEGLFLLFFLL